MTGLEFLAAIVLAAIVSLLALVLAIAATGGGKSSDADFKRSLRANIPRAGRKK